MNVIFFSIELYIRHCELVHLYLSDRVQMSIKYHYDPEILSLTMDIQGFKKNVQT